MKRNETFANFANGEWSPLMAARVDSDDYKKSLAWCQNFVVLPQGGLRYRPGSFLAGLAPSTAYMIPFQFSADDAIVIEATDSLFRFYRNGGLILNSPVTITGISLANPGVVTAAAHGFTAGQQVYISGVWGMLQVNDRYFTVGTTTTNTFQLLDQFGNNVNTTAYSAYTANGSVASVVTLATPYAIADIPKLRYAQVGDIVYIVHPNYAPQKLVRSSFTSWAIGTFTRTNDPFSGQAFTPTAITEANPGVVTVSSTAGMQNGDTINIRFVQGMTQLNKNTYTIGGLTATTFQLFDINGNPLNTSGFGAFTGNSVVGGITDVNNWPSCVAFSSDGRLVYGNSRQNPQGIWGSELPSGTTTNYDNFPIAAGDDTKAYAFQFSPVDGRIDDIQELKQFGGMIGVLQVSSILQAYGATTGQPPTPSAIGTLPTIQGSAKVMPLSINWDLLFVDVNQKKLRGLQFNFYYSAFEAVDYNINSQQFGEESQFVKIVHMKGIPEIVWVLRADGVLLSFTFDNVTKVNAWARHYAGGAGQVVDICSIRNVNGDDQLYVSVQRMLNGQTYNTIEYLSGWPDIPLRHSFYSGVQATDTANWQQATWEQLKLASFLDMSRTYNGAERGVTAGATITPSATTGNAITLTASAAVFQPSDVGSKLWKFYNANGSGGGQARLTAVVSSTQATADVEINFDSTAAIPAGDWAFAVNKVVNLQLFAGQTLSVQADGGSHPAVAVAANGSATLQQYASVIQFGFGYTGLAITQNLDMGSEGGNGNSMPRNIKRIRPRVDASIGGKMGTSPYALQNIITRKASQPAFMPPMPAYGADNLVVLDRWGDSIKHAVISHADPVPLTVLGLDIEMDTNYAA